MWGEGGGEGYDGTRTELLRLLLPIPLLLFRQHLEPLPQGEAGHALVDEEERVLARRPDAAARARIHEERVAELRVGASAVRDPQLQEWYSDSRGPRVRGAGCRMLHDPPAAAAAIIHTLDPLMIHDPPAAAALVRIARTSVPAPASLMHMPFSDRPAHASGR